MSDLGRVSVARCVWIGLIGGAVLVACEAPDSAVVTRETEDGPVVINVRSPDEIPAGHLRLLWRHQSEEWIDPSDVEMSGTGLVAILDPPAGRVHVIGSEEQHVRSWGRLGAGPGEWQGVVGLVLHGEQVLVQPSSAPYVERFGPDGELGQRLEPGQPLNLIATNDSLVIARSPAHAGRLFMLDVRDGAPVREFEVGSVERYPPEEYGACWRLTAAQDRVYRLSCSAGRIEVLDLEGTRIALIELADEPRASSEEELDTYIERFWMARSDGRPLDPLIRQQLEGVREAAAILPRYAALRADPRSGRLILLEQPFGDHGSAAGILHVVSPEGEHVSRVETQARVRDLAVVGDTVALLVRDSLTDLIELQVHVLEVGSTGS